MNKEEKSKYLRFYQEQNIIPTTQNTSDWSAHVRTRLMLYSQLGLPPSAFTGSDILEIGPGTGQNARVIHEWKPKSLTLVDANPLSIKESKRQFQKTETRPKFILSKIEEAKFKQKFDVVLCEGMLSIFPENPAGLFAFILSQAKTGGVVVVTCMDPVSMLPEMLRRWVGRKSLTGSPSASLEARATEIVKTFKRDLDNLKGMTRRREDWAIDNILSPWEPRFFSIPCALDEISKNGDWIIQGSSPRFLQDWRWHKALALEKPPSFSKIKDSYMRFLPNLLDYRSAGSEFEEAKSKKIGLLCEKICYDILGENVSEASLASKTLQLARLFDGSPITGEALNEFLDFLKGVKPYSQLKRFPKLWGRGQQYLSFQRLS